MTPLSPATHMQPAGGPAHNAAGKSLRNNSGKVSENRHDSQRFSTLVKNRRNQDSLRQGEDKTKPISVMPDAAAPVLAQGGEGFAVENEKKREAQNPEDIPGKDHPDGHLVKPEHRMPQPPRSLAQPVHHAGFPDAQNAQNMTDKPGSTDTGREKPKDINIQKDGLASDLDTDGARPPSPGNVEDGARRIIAAATSHGRKAGRILDKAAGKDNQVKVSLNIQERHFAPVNMAAPAKAYETAAGARQVMRAVDGAIPHLIARQRLQGASGIKVVKRLDIQLHPASLGTVTARLSLSGGALKITISVPDHKLADHLKRRLDPLVRKIHARYPAMEPASVSIITPPAASPAPTHSTGGAGIMDAGGQHLSGSGQNAQGQAPGQEGQRHVFTDDRPEENHAGAKNGAPDAAGHPSGDDSIYL